MSDIAKSGFITEDEVVAEFLKWQSSKYAIKWLDVMGFSKVNTVQAKTTRSMGINSKADVLITINKIHEIGISIKKFTANFNQIDKRWVDNYQKIWHFSNNVSDVLKKYCGQKNFRPMDVSPVPKVKDERRYFLSELSDYERNIVLDFFNNNHYEIVKDILMGSQKPKADFMMVVRKNNVGLGDTRIVDIESVIKHYDGDAKITPRGNLKIGKITVQRKGGNGGGPTAQMLQFKFSPNDVFTL